MARRKRSKRKLTGMERDVISGAIVGGTIGGAVGMLGGPAGAVVGASVGGALGTGTLPLLTLREKLEDRKRALQMKKNNRLMLKMDRARERKRRKKK